MSKQPLSKKQVPVKPYLKSSGKAVTAHVSTRNKKMEGITTENNQSSHKALQQLTEGNELTSKEPTPTSDDSTFDVNKFAIRREELLAGWDNSSFYGPQNLSEEELSKTVDSYWSDGDEALLATFQDNASSSDVKYSYRQVKGRYVKDLFLTLSDDYPNLSEDELLEKANANAFSRFDDYMYNGINTVGEFELLEGKEPPELTEEEKGLWDDKWDGWKARHNALTLSEISLVEGTYGTPIKDARFAVLDFETTGFDIDKGHRVIEVGCEVINSKGQILNKFTTLIYPGSEAADKTAEAYFVHKIERGDIEDAPRFAEISDRFLYMFDNAFIVAQNKRFEEIHLANEVSRLGIKAPLLPSICTATWSRFFVADKTENHKLGTMAEYFDIPLGEDAHTTEADVAATSQLLVQQLKFLESQGFDTLYHNHNFGSFSPPKTTFKTKRRALSNEN